MSIFHINLITALTRGVQFTDCLIMGTHSLLEEHELLIGKRGPIHVIASRCVRGNSIHRFPLLFLDHFSTSEWSGKGPL